MPYTGSDPVTPNYGLILLQPTDYVQDALTSTTTGLGYNSNVIDTELASLQSQISAGAGLGSLELDIFASGFVVSGLTASSAGNTLTVTAGIAYLVQSNGQLSRLVTTIQTPTTSVINTTYYFDLNPDGTYSFNTTHSVESHYLTICQVTTGASGQISAVTDMRILTPGQGAVNAGWLGGNAASYYAPKTSAAYRDADASEMELTTTGATPVVTFTPSAAGNFMTGIYVRVVTAATILTVTVTYTDAGGAQTNTLISAQSTAVGSYSILFPLFINSVASQPITVTITAGTANQVYASASIVGV
jgi:hypothetical protein